MAQKLLLFWRKPARRCWWEGVDLENVEGIDGTLKVWIRRVWTLEMVSPVSCPCIHRDVLTNVSRALLVSAKRSWNYTSSFFFSCPISYLRFDHTYPDKTELLLFLLFLPPSFSPASLVCSAHGRTTAQSGSNNAFLSSGYHGITDASCFQKICCSQNGITVARWIASAVVSFDLNLRFIFLVLSCLVSRSYSVTLSIVFLSFVLLSLMSEIISYSSNCQVH